MKNPIGSSHLILYALLVTAVLAMSGNWNSHQKTSTIRASALIESASEPGRATRTILPANAPVAQSEPVQANSISSGYEITYQPEGNRFSSPNRAQNMHVSYAADGFLSLPAAEKAGSWELNLRLESIGRAEEKLVPRPIAQIDAGADICVDGGRMSVQHDGFRINYTNNDAGMRQDFIVEQRPAGNGPLTVELRAEGNLRPTTHGEDDILFVRTGDNSPAVWYKGLKAWDADGKELAAHVKANDDLIALVVNDAGAEYPVTVDPLLSDANWTEDSIRQVANAGDVNNDGYDDVIVNGTAGMRAYYGSATGLATAPSWIPASVSGVSYSGDVAGAGDVNGDTYDDVIVQGFASPGNVRYVYVFLGSASGLQSNPAWSAQNIQTNSQFGESVSTAGDVNNDGYDDIIVGAPGYNNGVALSGAALVYYGSASGPSPTHNWLVSTGNGGAYMGYSVACAGDVNNDGYDDVIIGSPYYRNNTRIDEGAVYIYHGSASGLPTAYNWMVKGNINNAYFGLSVSSAGDVNADGYDDVIAGLPSELGASSGRGRAYIFLGSSTGVATVTWWIGSRSESRDGDQYGASVSAAGDVNADGYDDVIIGSSNYELFQSGTGTGAAFLYYGGPSTMTFAWSVFANASDLRSHRLGASVAGAGDVNNDGASDVIIASRGTGVAGNNLAVAYYGILPGRQLSGAVINELGNPIAGATVMLDNNPATTATTNAQGQFVFAQLVSQGYHAVTASATGYQTAMFDLSMPNADKHVVLGLSPAGPPPNGPYTICGTVTSTDGNGPVLSGVTVDILQSGNIIQTTATNEQGKFCSAPLEAGSYQVRFTKPGYQIQTMDLTLNSDKQIVASLVPSSLE